MTARTHDLAALTAFGVVLLLASPNQSYTLPTMLVAVLANQIGGIIPDIDQPTAPLWRNLPIGHYFGKIFGKMLGGHRFLTHSLVGLFLFHLLSKLALAFLHPLMPQVDTHVVWLAFMVGMVSHLLMDTLTKEGVPWLLPIPIKFGIPPVRALRITTGKWTEKIVFLALATADILYITSHYDTLLHLFHDRIM